MLPFATATITHGILLRASAPLNSTPWVVIGLLILRAIGMIPFVGCIIWALSSIRGFGVALATRYGRREPWFLAWRVAEA